LVVWVKMKNVIGSVGVAVVVDVAAVCDVDVEVMVDLKRRVVAEYPDLVRAMCAL
jgi:hypothetical protein